VSVNCPVGAINVHIKTEAEEWRVFLTSAVIWVGFIYSVLVGLRACQLCCGFSHHGKI
jgi:hypothetical protein